MLLEYFDFADRQSHRCGVKKTIIRTSSPLFTEVPRRGILGSSLAGSCIYRPLSAARMA
jgi:hypothetical protein